MERFVRIRSNAAPLPMINVDTDKIIPKQFLKTIKRTGLGGALFFELRYDGDGREIASFVLNRTPYRTAKILVTGENFGCGSSREHAPWALLDFGFRAIIAPSFADIFYNNCFKNGILPVVLPADDVDRLMRRAEAEPAAELVVDLERQEVIEPDGRVSRFEVDPFRKACLLDGLDDIGLTMQKAAAIDAFEARQRTLHPWLYT